ncbi:hypothetical protein [Stigmatella aurantiaca]|uniref:Conserved uncharacterized protein n=1 Tax=Stigmatella aurantiaca (strain DW4/3-1) TaxID=378806 RepID=Q08W30_STIAD|nr:hypothetical protein [Stigmatella aurantiaca]ADO75111.1 conserved uncharacterized protein [Stigmatella aurantiaca DW4/3-1]EAU64694.1 hypothetical protein STIAU_6335 [Stigmatella aurantiaca DW4/3-1]
MAAQSLATKMLEGAFDWVKRLPSALSKDVVIDMGQKRVRLSHARVEALTRQALGNVKAMELRAWESRPEVYDVRLAVSGWRLRVEATLERLELSSSRYKLWLRTPGKVELEESLTASALMGVLRAGAGKAAVQVLAEKLLPPGLRWNGRVLEVEGKLPADGVVPTRLFESCPLALAAEHSEEGLWLSAEAWPGLVDLLQAVFGADLPRKPPGA